MTTGTPSAERWTSNSTASTPHAIPRRNAANVFSGARASAPRCPTTSGREPGEQMYGLRMAVTLAPAGRYDLGAASVFTLARRYGDAGRSSASTTWW